MTTKKKRENSPIKEELWVGKNVSITDLQHGSWSGIQEVLIKTFFSVIIFSFIIVIIMKKTLGSHGGGRAWTGGTDQGCATEP